jgi:tyrosine-protein kinase Etk/Wzc
MHLKLENQNNQEALETIDLRQIATTLLAHKKIVAIAMLICFIFASLFVELRPPVYQTAGLVQVNNQGESSGLSFGALTASAMPSLGSASQSDIEITLINSDYILAPVIHQLGLDINVQPKYFPLIGGYIAHQYEGETPAPAKFGLTSYAWGGEAIKVTEFNPPFDDRMTKYSLIAQKDNHYRLLSPNGTPILTGQVGEFAHSTNGELSILVAQMNARPGTVFYVEKNYQTAVLAALRDRLKTTELSPPTPGSMAHTGIIQLSINTSKPTQAKQIIDAIIHLAVNQNSSQQIMKNQNLLRFIQKQLPLTQASLSAAETELNRYQAQSGILNLSDQSKMLLTQISQLDNEVTLNQVNEATLLQTYTPKDPIIENINIKNQSLNTQRAKLQEQLARLPMQDQKAIDLMRNVKVQSETYTLLLNKYQQTLLAKAAVTSNVSVLTYAQIPDEANPSYADLILLASLLAGFILGSLIVLSMNLLGAGISDPYWAEKELGIRTLAILPFSPTQAKAKKAFDKKHSAILPILAKSHPDDVCIESIRSLRTNLLLSIKEHKTNVISIGGIIPQTGKSFISVNLATILSESGKRVLLIDADMRRGYLNQYFSLSHSPGLSEALEAVYPLEQVIRRTSLDNLDFMSTGVFPHNPSELLLHDHFAEMIKVVSSQYDVVLIDAPPILAVNDASLIAQKSGLNYLVIPGGQLKAHEIESAVRRFYNDGVKIHGALFNFAKKSHEQTSAYGHSYGRYAQYYKRKQ